MAAQEATIKKGLIGPLVGVSRRDFTSDFCAFLQVTANGDISRWGASPISLLKTAIAAIEACDDLTPAFATWRFSVDECLHLIAPFRSLIRAANRTQIMECAQDFAEPLQVAIKGCRRLVLRTRGQNKAQQD